jgi:hydroxypyruvate reductase
VRAALDAVDAGRLVRKALEDADVMSRLVTAAAVDVVAVGKASGAMLNACVAASPVPLRTTVGIGPSRPTDLPDGAIWHEGGHPLPNLGSVAAAEHARDVASACGDDDLLLVLLSGGGSALMALPAAGVSLAEKQETARRLMENGADIYELNTVRKHLSAIKGGQLAASCAGSVLTLALSDVVGDSLSVIASGPTVPDESTYAAALAVLDRRGGVDSYPDAVAWRLARGRSGGLPETPKPGDPRLKKARANVIGPQRGAIDGGRAAAEAFGYYVHVIDEPVTGEARISGAAHLETLARASVTLPRPLCIISAGETTVTVTGSGKGGRNQEFAFALAEALDAHGAGSQWTIAAASIGTDGIDGPTDAAGAIVDGFTFDRARAAGLEPRTYLDDNNTYEFFDRLGDLVRTGPTNTNVGDLQVVLIA